jgi:hypothetical protein
LKFPVSFWTAAEAANLFFYPGYIVFIPTKAFYAYAGSLASSFLQNKKPGFCSRLMQKIPIRYLAVALAARVSGHDASGCGSRQNQFVKTRDASRLQTSARHPTQNRRLFENRRPSCEPIPIPAPPGFPAYFADVLSSGMRIA